MLSSVSVSAATRLAHDIRICILIRATYADLTLLFFSLSSIRLVSVIIACIIYLLFLFVFHLNLPLQSYWSLSCDHGLQILV